MENYTHVLISLGLILLGWLIAEVSSSMTGKEKGTKVIVNIIGIIITQRDVRRLLLGILLGGMFLLLGEDLPTYIDANSNHKLTYVLIGYVPTLFLKILDKAKKNTIK